MAARTVPTLADEKDYFTVIIRYMNKTTSKLLLLLSLSKTLADLLTQSECVAGRSVLVKASESECGVPTSRSRHTHPLSALRHFGWKYIIICCTTEGGQPERPAAIGGEPGPSRSPDGQLAFDVLMIAALLISVRITASCRH